MLGCYVFSSLLYGPDLDNYTVHHKKSKHLRCGATDTHSQNIMEESYHKSVSTATAIYKM